jgi:hypothetical protein
MNRKIFTYCFSILLLGAACLAAGLAVSALVNTSAKAEDQPAKTEGQPAKTEGQSAKAEGQSANITSIKGTCEFMRQQGTWTAKLTPSDTPGVYDAQYVASYRLGGDHMTYVGQIKSDFKTTINGSGKSTGNGGNGNFEFSGNYGADGIAKCNYKEIGGQRSGTLTAEKPQ